MRRWHWFSLGMAAGLVLAVTFGFARSTQQSGQSVDASLASVGNIAGDRTTAASKDSPVTVAIEAEPPDDGKLRIIAFGAHPDDCEFKIGAAAATWSALGHHVKFVSTTNGDIGHWGMAGGPLAQRRTAEVQEAAKILGITTEVLDIHDGELMPTLENRRTFTRLIRRWKADIVLAHRTNDYHPDHRYTGVLVQDAAYMVTVPFFCPDTPRLRRNPVFLHYRDGFQRPLPFQADVVGAIDEAAIEKKADAAAVIESQLIEGGCGGNADRVPKDATEWEARRKKLRERLRESYKRAAAATADRYRDKLIELYGEEKGKQVRYAEAFGLCEYGRRPKPEELKQLFPFPPKKE